MTLAQDARHSADALVQNIGHAVRCIQHSSFESRGASGDRALEARFAFLKCGGERFAAFVQNGLHPLVRIGDIVRNDGTMCRKSARHLQVSVIEVLDQSGASAFQRLRQTPRSLFKAAEERLLMRVQCLFEALVVLGEGGINRCLALIKF